MLVVSDTTSINYLVWIDEIELLARLYGKVVLPQSVQEELTRPEAPEAVRDWAKEPPEWVEVRAAQTMRAFPGLGAGETEAIALALSLNADFVLMDERKGRRIASEQGLAVLGTLIILELAAERGLISLPETLEKLKQTSFHVSERVLQEILSRNLARQRMPSIESSD